jgi:hypothetical protein
VKKTSSNLECCCDLVRKACNKHAPSLLPDLENKIKVLRDKKYYRENPRIFAEVVSDLAHHLESCSLERKHSGHDQAGPGLFRCIASMAEAYKLPTSHFLSPPLPDSPRDTQTAQALSAAAGASSLDGEISDSSTIERISLDSAEPDSDTERAAVYVNVPVSACSSNMQLVEAYVSACLSQDCARLFHQVKDCIDSNEELAELMQTICSIQDVPSASVPGAEPALLESPTVRILAIMVERGIPSDLHHRVWIACMRRVRSEIQFMEKVNTLARNGFFSVDRAIATRSHVVFLRMTKFAAWAMLQMLSGNPTIKDSLHEIGINYDTQIGRTF